MVDARGCGTVRAILKGIGSGTLGSLVATPSLLRRVIKTRGQDIEISSFKDRVWSSVSDEG